MKVKTGIGQDSHRFDLDNTEKNLILGGVTFPGTPPLKANSDGDVILHALTNAISGITGKNILGAISDDLCFKQGITDSRIYLEEAMKSLGNYQITHVSLSMEARKPKISPRINDIKTSLAKLLNISPTDIGLTATTGEELTEFGKGQGIQVFCVVTAVWDA